MMILEPATHRRGRRGKATAGCWKNITRPTLVEKLIGLYEEKMVERDWLRSADGAFRGERVGPTTRCNSRILTCNP